MEAGKDLIRARLAEMRDPAGQLLEAVAIARPITDAE